jgi:DNA-binding MarR family transcriptional regulator
MDSLSLSHYKTALALKQQDVPLAKIAACLGRDKDTVARALKDLQPSPIGKALQA